MFSLKTRLAHETSFLLTFANKRDLLFATIAEFFKLASHASLIESIVSNCITNETRRSEKVH